ncbi:MAG: hypothetical protein SF162_07420 [bacterium]|nr:hypothetical protein [bacterium]
MSRTLPRPLTRLEARLAAAVQAGIGWLGSPVSRAEAQFQRRSAHPRRGRWLGTAMFGTCAGAVTLAVLRGVIAANPGWFRAPLDVILLVWDAVMAFTHSVLIFCVAAHYFSMLAGAVQASTGAVVREKTARTWETLLLTGVDARALVIGKWAATLSQVWRQHRRLLLPRLCAIAWLGLTTAVSEPYSGVSVPALISVPFVTVLAALALPVINIALGAAIGLVGSLFGSTPSSARAAASLLQGSLVVLVFILSILLVPMAGASEWTVIVLPMAFSSFDGGITAVLTLPHSIIFGERLLIFIVVTFGYAAAAGGAIWGLLRLAERLAVRQNVSPHPQP